MSKMSKNVSPTVKVIRELLLEAHATKANPAVIEWLTSRAELPTLWVSPEPPAHDPVEVLKEQRDELLIRILGGRGARPAPGQSRKVHAVKEYRNYTGASLRDAVDYIEDLMLKHDIWKEDGPVKPRGVAAKVTAWAWDNDAC